MSDKFTIKFKGILDHAATKKAIEQDISKMEKYLKPKKSSLGSTKDIVKNNLSDKKKELSRQSKFESLRERVEKYRLTQTKKLMKQGMGFEKARKEAFKRSLMSDRDKRRLEYKELAKESKAKSKMLAASQGKGLVAKIAIGRALGNVIGNAVSKVGGGFFGFITGFIKKSVEAVSKKEKAQKLISSGQASIEQAATAIDDYLRGNGDMLYKIMVGTRVGWKYKQRAKDNFQKAAMHKDFGFRLTELQKVAADFESFNLTEFAGEKEKIDSDLINLEQSLMDVTAAGMQPVLKGASEIIEWVRGIMSTYKEGGITGIISNMVSAIVNPIIQPFKDLWAMIENSWFAKKIAEIARFLGLG